MLNINQPTSSRGMIGLLWRSLQKKQKPAIVTLVNIEGNAPYPIGSQMIVYDEHHWDGQITGGCAEQAIAAHASKALTSNENSLHRYGRDSPYFDIQLPCGSGIDVFIDVDYSLETVAKLAAKWADRESPVWQLGSANFEIKKILHPDPRLIIIGQGPILIALARLASICQYETLIIAQTKRTQDELLSHNISSNAFPIDDTWLDSCDQHTGLITLLHEHEHETELFMKSQNINFFYRGALGSQQTRNNRNTELKRAGASDSFIESINAPIGLNIRAVSPEDIAVSIIAQVTGQYHSHFSRS